MAGLFMLNDDQFLEDAVNKSKWPEVVWYLCQKRCSTRLRHRATEEIAKYAKFDYIQQMLFEGLADDHIDVILQHLTSRNMWITVKFALERNVSTKTKTWAVVQASKHAPDHDIAQYILREEYLTDWSDVLASLVSRGMWESVGTVLEYNISHEQHAWATEEASERSDEFDFNEYILPQCSEKELKQVTPHLVARGLWKSVEAILQRNTDSALHARVIQEAIQHADDIAFVKHVLPYCEKYQQEQLEQVLTHLVSRNLWKKLGFVLRRPISRTSRQWAINQASIAADEILVMTNILCICTDDELGLVLTNMVARGLWKPADDSTDSSIKKQIMRQLVLRHQWKPLSVFLSRTIDAQHSKWAVEEAIKHGVDMMVSAFPQKTEFMPLAVLHGQWKWISFFLNKMVFSTMLGWTKNEESKPERQLWELCHSFRVPLTQALKLYKAAFRMKETYFFSDICSRFSTETSLSNELAELLFNSLLNTVCYALCSEDRNSKHYVEEIRLDARDIYSWVISCVLDNRDSEGKTQVIQNKAMWTFVFKEISSTYIYNPLFLLNFLQNFHLFYSIRNGESDDNILLKMLAVLPLFPQTQSMALKLMVHSSSWDIISQACLSHVWEHDRRQLFKAAVMQRQWGLVKQWSDHTVHDDQRNWAMQEASKEKQWDVYLLLADFGLTMEERMHAHCKIVKFAEWDIVLHMFERGGDVEEVRLLLENFAEGRLRHKPQGDASVYQQRCQRLLQEESHLRRRSHMDPIGALKTGDWRTVMFNIAHSPRENYFAAVIKKAIQKQAWHVLMHMVRLGMNRNERDDVFSAMVTQQQWPVCRMLLEHGISVHLCLEALPELMQHSQWTMVARVMEYDLDDALRRQVMQWAFYHREGALFWHCLITMKDEQPLPVPIREKLFLQALSLDIWQAVRVLLEYKGGLGVHFRDLAFLEAIDKHLWDVVDLCQLYGADINMKDMSGEIPLHREVKKKEWKAVEEIVFRDGNPNLLDKDGISILNWLIHFQQWNLVKFVIKYGADIHYNAQTPHSLIACQCANERKCSPLQTLIKGRWMDMIQFTLLWCPEQGKGVTASGETVLHAACDSGRWDLLWDFIARKADPQAVTRQGKSALAYAVKSRQHSQMIVAECIRLGFSTHQPLLTQYQCRVVDLIIHEVSRYSDEHFHVTSPFLLSLMRGDHVVARMLYESGSCSYEELFILYTQLPDLTDRCTEEGTKLYGNFHKRMVSLQLNRVMEEYHMMQYSLQRALPFLEWAARTPRSLKSSCRLAISHYRDVRRKQRHLDMLHFPQLLDELKGYVLFSDLTNPSYSKDLCEH